MKKAVLAILACLGAGTAPAQSGAAGFFNPLSASHNGIHLYGVSVNGGYYSGASPLGNAAVGTVPSAGAMTVTGASASFGWSRSGDQSSVSIGYSPSYTAYPQRTEFNSLSHALTLSWHRKLGRKWSVNVTGAGLVANLQQTYFAANAFGLAASLPTTFDGLSGAMLSGKYSDAQLASALTGASAHLLPEQNYLYGQRIGSVSATASFEYEASERSSFHASLSANRVQRLQSGVPAQDTTQAVIPQTTAGSASLGWGYSLTTRTHLGLDVGTSRAFSRLQDGYTSTAQFSIGRTMSEHWFVNGRVGTGVLTYQRQRVSPPRKLQGSAGGSMGYKLRSHTMLASFDRSLGDSYGLGSASTNAATLGWAWKAPGSMWSLSANFGYQQMNGSVVQTTESWRATGGVARALGAHVFMSVQYAYFTSPINPVLAANTLGGESGVSVSLSWSPSQYR